MTSSEREKVWEAVSSRFLKNQENVPVRKPILSRLYYRGLLPLAHEQIISFRKKTYALNALVGLLIVSGSMSVFAEGALPGDVLYPVKTHLTEKIQFAFAFTPQEKATAEAILATRRLEEAERLALAGKLSPTLAEKTAGLFTSHVKTLEGHLVELETRSQFADVAKIGVLFQTRVAVHAAVLKDIEINTSILSSTTTAHDNGEKVDPHVVALIEKEVLTTVLPTVAVTKAALAKLSASSSSNMPRTIEVTPLYIDPALAKSYLTELHEEVGIPESILGAPISPVVPVFVP
jgi:hypothetical protein